MRNLPAFAGLAHPHLPAFSHIGAIAMANAILQATTTTYLFYPIQFYPMQSFPISFHPILSPVDNITPDLSLTHYPPRCTIGHMAYFIPQVRSPAWKRGCRATD